MSSIRTLDPRPSSIVAPRVINNIAEDPTISQYIDTSIIKERMFTLIQRLIPTLPDQISLQTELYGRETELEMEVEKETATPQAPSPTSS